MEQEVTTAAAAAAATNAVHCGCCGGDLDGAILMTCLHALCRNCAPSSSPNPTSPSSSSSSSSSSNTRRGSQAPANLCPLCGPLTSSQNGVTSSAVATMTSRVAAKPCVSLEEVLRRARKGDGEGEDEDGDDDDDDDDDNDNDDDNDERVRSRGNSDETSPEGGGEGDAFSTTLTFPCPQHSHRTAEHFCLTCAQLACSKCLTSYHRKCNNVSTTTTDTTSTTTTSATGSQQQQEGGRKGGVVTCAEAVNQQRPLLNSLHSQLAQRVLTSQDRRRAEEKHLGDIQKTRVSLLGQIRAQREALTAALLEAEGRAVEEVEAALGKAREGAEARAQRQRDAARAAEGQLSVLEAVMSVKGEPEILSLLPSLHARLNGDSDNDEKKKKSAASGASSNIVFHVNTKLHDVVTKSELGEIARADSPPRPTNGPEKTPDDASDVILTHMTSFHARTREDRCDPLLTDLLLLPAGDVIVTDRDNKCVKKFNGTGHLLTRVPIPEVPSRIALVSHGKAAISVMTRKVLLFLSLLGTVRILSSVRVKKQYCFLASAGHNTGQNNGGQGQGECQLLAATSLCDVIDLISETGVLLRRLYTHRGEKVNLSRPLYLHAPQSRGSSGDVAALVVDSGRRVLFALTSEGQTTFTFRAKDAGVKPLECPLGVATVPQGGSAPGGLILLADRDTHRVLLLGRKGVMVREVLGAGEGLSKPCALYASIPKRLALTQVDGWVKIYKLE